MSTLALSGDLDYLRDLKDRALKRIEALFYKSKKIVERVVAQAKIFISERDETSGAPVAKKPGYQPRVRRSWQGTFMHMIFRRGKSRRHSRR